MSRALLAIAIAVGLLIAYVDSRPTWDDTGVTAAAVFTTCGVFGALAPHRPWMLAAAVGTWIPLVAVLTAHNYAALVVVPLALAGAYAGALLRRGAGALPG